MKITFSSLKHFFHFDELSFSLIEALLGVLKKELNFYGLGQDDGMSHQGIIRWRRAMRDKSHVLHDK